MSDTITALIKAAEQAREALEQVKPANLTREQFRAQLALTAAIEDAQREGNRLMPAHRR